MLKRRPVGSGVTHPHAGWWVSVVSGMVLTAVLAFDSGAYATWCALVTARISQRVLRGIFVAACITHLGEGLYAWRLARRAGLGASAGGWFLQTVTLGFPSLRLLRRRAARDGGAPPRLAGG